MLSLKIGFFSKMLFLITEKYVSKKFQKHLIPSQFWDNECLALNGSRIRYNK